MPTFHLRHRGRWLAAALVLAAAACTGPSTPDRAGAIAQVPPSPGLAVRPLTDRTFERTEARRARGEYLAQGLLQCFVCHSERDWTRPGAPPLRGREGAGVVWRDDGSTRLVAANLTPDDDTGIGRWSDDMLARAIREGVGHDGRVLSAAMPYAYFRGLPDEDLAAVVVYLRSLRPIRNPLRRTVLSTAEATRYARRAKPVTAPVPAPPDDPLERGRHLVSMGMCEGCHTAWEAPSNPGMYAGGNRIERGRQHAFSSNLTPHPTGLALDADGFIALMRTGKGGLTHGTMPWVALRNLDDADLAAIHRFLASRHGFNHRVSNLVAPTQCAVCGQSHGLGDANHVEPLVGPAVAAPLRRAYAGTYRSEEHDWSMSVIDADGRLYLTGEDMPRAELVALPDGRFLHAGAVAPLRFDRDADGRVVALVSEETRDLALARVDAATGSGGP